MPSKPPIQQRLGLSSPFVNLPQFEADHSLPFNAEVQEWRSTCNSQYTSMAYTDIILPLSFHIIFRTRFAPQKLNKIEYDPLTMITPEVTKYIMKHELALATSFGPA